MDNAKMNFDEKYPYLVYRNKKFSDLVIKSAHNNVIHNGVDETLCNIGQQYWIPKPRSKIKCVFKQCVTRRIAQGNPFSYPDECQERVAVNHTFKTAGIDYLSLVYVKNIFSIDNSIKKHGLDGQLVQQEEPYISILYRTVHNTRYYL